jgi:hypothetical protein
MKPYLVTFDLLNSILTGVSSHPVGPEIHHIRLSMRQIMSHDRPIILPDTQAITYSCLLQV